MAPDDDLAPTVMADTPQQLKAIADPLRAKILDLVPERAATVTELAVALVVSDAPMPDGVVAQGFLAQAFTEAPARGADQRKRSTIRHARIPDERAEEFFSRVNELAEEFTELPRAGDTVWGFVVAVYPTEHPTLGEPS